MHLVLAAHEVELLGPGDVLAAQSRVVEARDAAARFVVKLLRLHIPERAEEHFAVFAVEAVDAAVAHKNGGDAAVFELVEPCAVEARRDEVQRVAVHPERAAAVTDVAADGGADGLAVDGVRRDGKRFIVELIEIAVGIHAEFAVRGHDEQEGLAECIGRDDEIGAAPDNALLLARREVHAVEILAAEVRGAGDRHIEQAVVDGFLILRELHVGNGEARVRQPGEGLFLRIVVEETLIRAARIGAAVPPPGQLGDDLVVLVLFFAVEIGLGVFFVALVEVFKAGEGRADGEQVAVPEREDLGHGDGEGVGKLGIAAVERDLIEAARE